MWHRKFFSDLFVVRMVVGRHSDGLCIIEQIEIRFGYFFHRLLPQKVQLLQVYLSSVPCKEVTCLWHFGAHIHCFWGPSSSLLEFVYNFLRGASRVFALFKYHIFFEHYVIYIYLLCNEAHPKFVN